MLVVETTSDIKALAGSPVTKRALEPTNAITERQVNPADPTGLAGTLTLVLLEIGGALNNIIAILGLSKFSLLLCTIVHADQCIAATLSFLGPLVGSLSLLIASLIPVVNNLLALVGAILTGVLGGLSLALAGLII